MKNAIIEVLSARLLGWFALALVSSAMGTAILGGVIIANAEQERGGWMLLQAALLLLAGWGIRIAHDDACNRLRDRDSAALVDQAQRSDPGPFVLYLRPFALDGRLQPGTGGLFASIAEFLTIGYSKRSGFEGLLSRRVRRPQQILQIGLIAPPLARAPLRGLFFRMRSRIGTCYTDPDDDLRWREVFMQLAPRARLCVIVPPHSANQQTEWEIGQLASDDHLGKCVFLMPSFSVRRPGLFAPPFKARALWSNLLRAVDGRAALPAYVSGGGLVVRGGTGFVVVRGIGGRPWHSPKVIDRVLAGGELTGAWPLDALRFAGFVSFLIVPGTVAALGTADGLLGDDQWLMIPVDALVIAAAGAATNRQCTHFLLADRAARRLFLGTLVLLPLALLAAEQVHWAPAFLEGSSGPVGALANMLALLLLLGMVPFVPLLAWAIPVFRARRRVRTSY